MTPTIGNAGGNGGSATPTGYHDIRDESMKVLSAGGESDKGAYIAIADVAGFLQRHVKMLVGCALLLSLVTVIALSFRERVYTSSASFVPQSSDRMSALAGLAAQFGVSAGSPDPTESPAFFADLLRTREVLTTVLQSEYRFPAERGPVQGTLINLMKVKESSAGLRTVKAIEQLTKELRIVHKARTGVISFDVTMPNPVLSQQVSQRFLDEVSSFSLKKRNTRAGAERRFTEGRIADLQVEQRNAEDRLQSFLQRNRDYRNSPDLSFQHDRMAQEVEFRRSVYTTVAQSNERARMDELRDTPVITVIEKPSLPARPDSRGLAKFGLLTFVFGGLIGVGIAFQQERVKRQRANGSSSTEASG